jgi:hypothetical protein
MIGGKLMVVEVVSFGCVFAADIDDGDGGIGEIIHGGLAAYDGCPMHRSEEAAGEEFIFVGTTGVGENEGDWHGMTLR